MRLSTAISFLCGLLAVSFHVTASARITRIAIDRVESPAFEGRSFGSAGQYEKLVGRAIGEVDPEHPLNRGVVNLDRAPRNARGMVEYEVDVYILKPVDMTKGNGTLLHDVLNRGNKRLFAVFHVGGNIGNEPKTAADAGDGFLLGLGYTLVMSGWQGDVPKSRDRLTTRFPVAVDRDGKPLTQVIAAEYVFTKPAFSIGIGHDRGTELLPYRVTARGMESATLSRRAGPHAQAEIIARDAWSFARCPDGKQAIASDSHVCLPAGFSTNLIYDLVYEAQDARVMGLGFAATRDVVSFLRFDQSAGNPLLGQQPGALARNSLHHAIGFGRSQSGRFLRDFVYQGFNVDEDGRKVFDGTISLTAGSRKTSINTAFAFPGRFSTPLEGHFAPGDQFPFSYDVTTDPVSGRTDGILRRCREQNACPNMMQWDSATEAWVARSSLVVTDPLGKQDIPLPDNVRLYYFAGTQHVPAAKPAAGICQMVTNPNPYKEPARALLTAMQDWIARGTVPPASRYPTLRNATLTRAMPQASFGFPEIPGVRYTGRVNDLFVNDYSAIPTRHVSGKQYTVLVPKVDADGNETDGIRSVTLRAPLGTYTGWNLRRDGFLENESCYLSGGFIPFAHSRAERGADPRPSLEERYGTHAAYVAKVEAAAREVRQEGFLLREDAERLVEEARALKFGLK
jgi:hypothetical protein